jgi:hypothetical protein
MLFSLFFIGESNCYFIRKKLISVGRKKKTFFGYERLCGVLFQVHLILSQGFFYITVRTSSLKKMRITIINLFHSSKFSLILDKNDTIIHYQLKHFLTTEMFFLKQSCFFLTFLILTYFCSYCLSFVRNLEKKKASDLWHCAKVNCNIIEQTKNKCLLHNQGKKNR